MSRTLAVMRGKLGTTEFFIGSMKAGEIVNSVRTAAELPDWQDMSIEERMQRDLDWKRIENEIARYLAEDEDRFFSALLVAIYNSDGMSFEPLSEINGVPELYAQTMKNFGCLHFQGGELLFALDGQHRLKGTDTAISGRDHKGNPIEGFERNLELANDDIPVVLIRYEPVKRSRKTFNKVNQYAKGTSKGDNIITSEDDACAIVTRWLMGSDDYDPIIPEELVNWRSNTLTIRMKKFTTASAMYDTARMLLGLNKKDLQFRPSDDALAAYYERVRLVWETLFERFEHFQEAIERPEDLPELRGKFLCLKPAGQQAVLNSVSIALENGLELEEVADRLNRIPWELTDELWEGVMVSGKRILAGRQSVHLASRLIAHLIGTPFSEKDQQALLRELQKARRDDPEKPKIVKTLPDPLVELAAKA